MLDCVECAGRVVAEMSGDEKVRAKVQVEPQPQVDESHTAKVTYAKLRESAGGNYKPIVWVYGREESRLVEYFERTGWDVVMKG
jgi:hypothetical protein